MTRQLPIYTEQMDHFERMQASIDGDLRRAGFDEFIGRHSQVDPSLGKPVVGRSFTYSTRLADIDRDLDPFATRIGSVREVGIATETAGTRTYKGYAVLQAISGEPFEPTELGQELSEPQLSLVSSSVELLLAAKDAFLLPSLTKSLRRIDVAGD